MSDDIVLPKVIKHYRTSSLTKGRILTTMHMFMIDCDVFDSICMNYIKNELSSVECRVGSTIKHPKDKYDKVIARTEAAKKLTKNKLTIIRLVATAASTELVLENGMTIYKKNDKVRICTN